MKFLVGGGSGFIGQHLRRLVESKGHEMINITRKAKSPKDLTWTLLERNGLPAGTDSVVNLSGMNIMTPGRWTEKLKREIIDSRVETTELLVNAVNSTDLHPASFISTSAIGYYGAQDDGSVVTEFSPAGDDFPAKLCKKWEQAVTLRNPDIRKVTVRIGLALGPDGGMMSSLYWPFYFGVGGTIGNGKQWFPWVHVDDVAGIILHSIESPTVTGVLNAVGPQCITNAEFTTTLARTLRRCAPFPVPKCVLNTLLGKERADMMLSSPRIVPHRTLECGYEFIYPDLQSACSESVKPS